MRRLAVAFVLAMAAIAGWALYAVVLPGIRAEAREKANDRGVVADIGVGPSAERVRTLMGAQCHRQATALSERFRTLPTIISDDVDGVRVDYVDTSAGQAWTYVCTGSPESPTLRPLEPMRSPANPRGWVRNPDGSMTALDMAGQPSTISGGQILLGQGGAR